MHARLSFLVVFGTTYRLAGRAGRSVQVQLRHRELAVAKHLYDQIVIVKFIQYFSLLHLDIVTVLYADACMDTFTISSPTAPVAPTMPTLSPALMDSV